MELINIKNKEIKFKDTSTFLIEDEVNPTGIQFVINEPDEITDVEDLTFRMQYYRSASDCGYDTLEKSFVNGVLYLTWHPSAGSTLNKGVTKLQIYGFKLTDSLVSVRWSTKSTSITLTENLVITQTSPTITPDYVAQHIGD